MSSRVLAFFAVVVVSFAVAPAVMAESLNTQAELIAALDTGKDVSLAINLSRCTPLGNAKISQTRGGRRIEAYRLISDGTLSFGETHFTVAASDGKPIQQFMRYEVRPDNSVRFTTYMFDLPSLQPRGDTPVLSYQCVINQGISFHAN